MQEPCLLYIFKSLEKFQAKKKKKLVLRQYLLFIIKLSLMNKMKIFWSILTFWYGSDI